MSAWWIGQSIRVEHLIAPGGWLTEPGRHLASCRCDCSGVQVCPRCNQPASPTHIKGRWDHDHGHTARPFDPVWVRLSCGCEAGDAALAHPTAPKEGR